MSKIGFVAVRSSVFPARAALWAAVLLLAGALGPPAAFPERPPAFQPGERLTYRLRWTIVDAGQARLFVRPMTTVGGEKAHHFHLQASTNAFIDAFYKVRDEVNGYADTQLGRSLRYEKIQREGSTERDEIIDFEWATGTARFTRVEKEKTEVKTTPLLPGTFDPLSAFFYVRSIPITGPGQIIERPITDGNKNVIGQVRVIKREKVTVFGKKYDTFLIEPDLKHVGGVFESSPGAKIRIWVTADHRQIPVILKSKVVVGSFVGELMEAADQ